MIHEDHHTNQIIQGCFPNPPKKYRYSLWRIWDAKKAKLLFIGLNPSTADAFRNDRTVTRCIDYARRWGYGSLYMANLFALRSTDCNALHTASDPIGPENEYWIKKMASEANCVVLAWGNHGSYLNQHKAILKLVKNPMCLKVTKQGHPAHPLYMRGDLKPSPYKTQSSE